MTDVSRDANPTRKQSDEAKCETDHNQDDGHLLSFHCTIEQVKGDIGPETGMQPTMTRDKALLVLLCCLYLSLSADAYTSCINRARSHQKIRSILSSQSHNTIPSPNSDDSPTDTVSPQSTAVSRRTTIHKILSLPVMLTTLTCNTLPSMAAGPITMDEAEGWKSRMLRQMRPKPPKLLRPKLDRDFAVLLMRTSYNVLDELDCVPMDQVCWYTCDCGLELGG
jgi:hypothetical protein